MPKLPLFRLSLRTKLVGIMLFTSMSLVVILILFYYRTERVLYNQFARQTAELSKAVKIGIEGASASTLNDPKKLQDYLNQLNPKGIKEISVISSSDRIVASTNQETIGKWITERRKDLIFKAELGEPVTGEGQVYNVVIPVVANNNTVGYIHLTLNAEDFSVFLRTSLIRRVIAALIVFALGTLLAVLLAGRYTKPIEKLAAAARRVAAGDLNQSLPAKSNDEIGDLSQSFNFMVGRLREDRDLRERLRTAEHLASVGQFAQSIAHEIKNPLNFISLSIDHIGDAFPPADREQAARFASLVGNIKGEVQRISRFAESFLEYGRPFELRRRRVSLGALLDGVLDLAQAGARQAGVRIERQYGNLPELNVDPEFIRTCLNNVVLNALEAMPGGGVLTVTVEVRGEGLILRVADTGSGVNPEHLDRIFEPFFTTKKGGLGLGLALTRKVIEEHDGRLQMENRPEQGCLVTLQLPLAGEQS